VPYPFHFEPKPAQNASNEDVTRPYITRCDAVVIGAGIAGLTAAAELARRGIRTVVVERHNVPGGCASFYQRDGYRFDVGATLVGGFGSRGIHRLLNERFGIVVSSVAIEPSMVVHLPDETVVRYGDERWPVERERAFGPEAESFWRAQERIADLTWDFSTRFPALPVDVPGALAFLGAVRPRQLGLVRTLGKTVSAILPRTAAPRLRAFVDAQLLITAQTDAAGADLAYGATALDLAREGTFHLAQGVSTLAVALARSARQAGGTILYNSSVSAIRSERGRVRGVVLSDGRAIVCDRIVSALPVHDTAALCPPLAAAFRARLAAQPQRWGAFMLYCALPPGIVPPGLPTHHQLLADYEAPQGEANTAFLSFSGPDEPQRARNGGRAVTLSTHTDVARWTRAYRDGTEPALRAAYTRKLLAALDRVVPNASPRAHFVEAATPHTFERYTRRHRGLVGGLPQTPATATFGAFTHRTPIKGLTLCGDTTFPGQSTVGAALSAVNATL
jgi:C-3',4' desaturase CrtD